jgi:hypothetical protein
VRVRCSGERLDDINSAGRQKKKKKKKKKEKKRRKARKKEKKNGREKWNEMEM